MKATAWAPANIAFIKYWGKADPLTRVPQNDSVSMNLSEMYTTTTVEFDSKLAEDEIRFPGEDVVTAKELERTVKALDKIRTKAGSSLHARVMTRNTFPKATGIASSASGFASLAVASFGALDIRLEEKELSKFCRTLSGTATRSIPDGFVRWQKGSGPDDSYGSRLYPPEHWDICDVVAIVTGKMKKVSSTDGHAIADTSPFYGSRMAGMEVKTRDLITAIGKKDFSAFGTIMEAEAINMHAICLTSHPPLVYWEPATVAVMKLVQAAREAGNLESYFTIDAGPTVHVICEGKNAPAVSKLLENVAGVQRIVINHPSRGARLIEEHLF